MSTASSKQIKFGAILSYTSIALNIVAGLIYTPWMVNQIGQGDYGLYTLANSLITLFLVDFGLSAATSRYIAKYRAEGRQEKIDNFLGAIYKLYLIVDTIIFSILLVLFFCLENIYVKLTPDEIEKFKVVYAMAASFAVINFPFVTLNGVLTAYEKFIQLKFADIIYRVLLVVLTVVALLCGYGLYALVATHSIVGLIVIAYKLLIINKSTEIKINWKHKEKGLYREIFSFSVWIAITTLASRLIFNITPSILGLVANSAAIAVFGIVTMLEAYVYSVVAAINGLFLPKISRIYHSGAEKDEIMPLMISVGRFQYALNGLIVVGFFTIGKSFINLWMGPDYLAAYEGILLIIIPGMFFNALEIANTALVVTKNVKTQALISLLTGVVNVVLSLILSSFLGAMGACLSIFVAFAVRAIAYIAVYQKIMKFDMKSFAKNCFLKMSVPIVIAAIFGLVMNYCIADTGYISLIIKGCSVVVAYLLAVFFTGLNKQERNILLKKVKGDK